MIKISAIDHVGIRVTDAAKTLDFYGKLGFEKVYEDPEDPVIVVRNAAGAELNFIVNAAKRTKYDDRNILVDIDEKYPGITHVALRVEDLEETMGALAEAGIELSGGPVELGDNVTIFIRDPDRTVIEINAPAADWSG